MENRRILTVSSLIILFCFVIYSQYSFVDRGPFLLCVENEGEASFSAKLSAFPWDNFTRATEVNDTEKIQEFGSLLFQTLLPFLIKSPPVPVNGSCIPPPLRLPPGVECKRLGRPRKVGVLLQFGFDVDALELHLHELDEVADKFFLIESVEPHSPFVTRKPLLWDRLKGEDRFAQFLGKIVHFIVDDADHARIWARGGVWAKEGLQEELRWRKFLQWNNGTQYFGDDDILGFGDTDEVPHRDNIHFLRHCRLTSDPVDIGIWFPFGGLHTVFETDQPVRGHPYTLGDPTYWTLGAAKMYQRLTGSPPNRMRGRSSGYLLGGIHLSRYSYLPYRFAKMLSATEAGFSTLKLIIEMGRLGGQGEVGLRAADARLSYLEDKWKRRLVNSSSFNQTEKEAVVKLPWFYECNSDRYPTFGGRWDPRLD